MERDGLTRTRSVALVAATGGFALLVAPHVPAVNAVVVALVSGLLVANIAGDRLTLDQAVADLVLKRVLKVAIVLLGAGIDLALVATVGARAVLVILAGILVALATAWAVGRRLAVGRRSTLLIGAGTAICGASAIVAVAPIIRARREEVAVALGTVLGFNALALLAYPVVGKVAAIDPVSFGAWVGVAVHDTASAVATGFALGPEAGEVATLVKLTRTLFLVPLLGIVALAVSLRGSAGADRENLSTARVLAASVPWFVVGFAALAVAGSLGWLGGAGEVLSDAARILVVFVVGAIGLTLRLREIAGLGRRLFLTGLAASAAIGVVALALVLALDIGAA